MPDELQQPNFADHKGGHCNRPATVLPAPDRPTILQPNAGDFSSADGLNDNSKNKNKKVFREGAVVIELFAGSSRFTAALKANGVHSAFGVDHKKLSSIAPSMIADLTTKAGQSLCMTWMDPPNLAGIFAAPPCGTCSLARNIKIR